MDSSKRTAGAAGDFPDDPLVGILSRVPAKSVCRLRCVSKAWRDIIDDPLNRRKLPQTLDGFFSNCFGYTKYLARSVPLDIDPCFSFLAKLPEIQHLCLEDSCNGLVLFVNYPNRQPFDIVNYIVCNPATKHWATVPTCGLCLPSSQYLAFHTLLAFDPAVSPHFHLIQIWKPDLNTDDEEWPLWYQEFFFRVHAYSSATGMWSHIQTDWNELGQLEGWRQMCVLDYALDVCVKRAFFNGILRLIVGFGKYQIVALDVQGRTKRLISMPAPPPAEGRCWRSIGYIGQSQGRLHYINQHPDAHDPVQSYELSIWVLHDYDTQEWVLKDTVSFFRLFGRMTTSSQDFGVVAIHPDCNVIFFLQPLNRLMAYDMNRKEVSVVACFERENLYMKMPPYIPYFSESPALPN